MPLQPQMVSIPLGGGMSTKLDPKLVQSPAVLRAENAIFDETGAARKRNGYTALPSSYKADDGAGNYVDTPFAAPRSLHLIDDALYLADQSDLYGYSPTAGIWTKAGGLSGVSSMVSMGISRGRGIQTVGRQLDVSAASGGGWTVYAWTDQATPGSVRCSVVDTTTGAVIVRDKAIITGLTNSVRVAVRACGDVVHCYVTDGATNNLRVAIFDPSRPGIFDLITAFTDIAVGGEWDVAPNPFSRSTVIVYRDTNGTPRMTVRVLDAAAGSIRSTTITPAGAPGVVAVCADDVTGQIGIAWSTATGANDVHASIYSPDLAIVVTSAAIVDTGSGATIFGMTCHFTGATAGTNELHLWYDLATSPPAHRHRKVNQAGTSTTIGTNRSQIIGRAFRRPASPGSVPKIVVPLQALPRASLPVQRYGYLVDDTDAICGRLPPLTYGPTRPIPDGEPIAGGHRLIVAEYAATAAANAARLGEYLIDWDHQAPGVQVGGQTYAAAGILRALDGSIPAEQGFAYGPDMATADAVSSNAGGSLTANGVYSYRVYYSRLLPSGERMWSTTTGSITITLGAGHNRVTLTIPTLRHTMSPDVEVIIFRTAAGSGANAEFRRVSSVDQSTAGANNGFVLNSTTTDTVTFVDTMSDATLASREPDRFANNAELDHIQPPSATLIVAGKGRVFLGGLVDDVNLVRYSKLREHGEPVEFNDTLEVQIPDEGGPIIALAIQDEVVICFKQHRIYVFNGPGLDNAGGGEGFSEPSQVQSDTGCSNARSIVATPMGIIFQSPKGICLLDRSLSVQYIGAPVEDFGRQEITAATLLQDRRQVRFLVRSGYSLLYDYAVDQWAIWTNHEGVDAIIWRGKYTYLRNDGTVYLEDEDAFSDAGAPYSLAIETPWIKLNGLQGYARCYWGYVLGEFKSAHRLRIWIAKDYATGFAFHGDWDATVTQGNVYGAGAPYGVDAVYGGSRDVGAATYQTRFDWPGMTCQTVRFRIEDVNAVAESMSLTELALKYGVRPTLHKLPAAKTTGAR